ncbi:glycolate oxidase subunit GlcE [Methylacidiphilum kamchatkense]|uniref:Glycolate oxidase FAD binding subunit n=1 Tax=Methylacidiphilum kamchatkense Kam1 TaxID=1202785 RepID=A0A516TLR6_9BACT|nr:glycolate oxidase subunit GlcE [Methylacidiphilum kamchatkense]QDQ42166.1 glycolate oxidase FAD binding subunit [Methylacidiphilum kamchatkense Kam1]
MIDCPSSATDSITNELIEKIRRVINLKEKIKIIGGGTKERLGRKVVGKPINVSENRGIITYDPAELFVTVKSGTPIGSLEEVLKQHGQYLPFEPPHLGEQATVGGVVACGLSGPSRPYKGALKDYLLKVRIINGKGEVLTFGSQVIKNVAGFDLFRLMAGAQGTLGIILDVTFKVLPLPPFSTTVVLEKNATEALRFLSIIAAKYFPLSASCYYNNKLYVRISGYEKSVRRAEKEIGGDILANDHQFWNSVKERTHPFFINSQRLWRLVLPQAAPLLPMEGEWFFDWGGSQRWWKGEEDNREAIFRWARDQGGYAWCHDKEVTLASPLDTALLRIHRRLKEAFDPFGLLNPGRIYEEF